MEIFPNILLVLACLSWTVSAISFLLILYFKWKERQILKKYHATVELRKRKYRLEARERRNKINSIRIKLCMRKKKLPTPAIESRLPDYLRKVKVVV
jgi:hypothetical protein